MFNLQGSEIIVILLLALVVLGPEKLPDAIRRFSRTYGELKKMGSGFQSELKSALDEPVNEMRKTADMVRDAADPDKVAAQDRHEQAAADRDEPAAKTTDDHAAQDRGGRTGATAAPAAADPDRSRPEPSAEPIPTPPQGDPPLVPVTGAAPNGADESTSGPDTAGGDGTEPGAADPPRRINHIAAANSSGAIAASARAAAEDQPAAPPAGPAFHSAGPRTVAPPDRADADLEVAGSADVELDADEPESSDEAATA